jgi:hypothetical protein
MRLLCPPYVCLNDTYYKIYGPHDLGFVYVGMLLFGLPYSVYHLIFSYRETWKRSRVNFTVAWFAWFAVLVLICFVEVNFLSKLKPIYLIFAQFFILPLLIRWLLSKT